MTDIGCTLPETRTRIAPMPIDMHALARHGASLRLAELQQEMAAITAAFPQENGVRKRGRPAKATGKPSRKGWSDAARAAVGERMKAYWAKRKPGAEQKAGAAEPATKPKNRTMSAEGKARIAAAQKKRWAAVRKAKKG
jgi:hypothetical protein